MSTVSCLFAKHRNGQTCDLYRAPSLWCYACWPALAAERGIDVRHYHEHDPGRASDDVTITISRPAAAFLRGTVEHLNQKKILPEDSRAALETSAWLEEIEARCATALEDNHG